MFFLCVIKWSVMKGFPSVIGLGKKAKFEK